MKNQNAARTLVGIFSLWVLPGCATYRRTTVIQTRTETRSEPVRTCPGTHLCHLEHCDRCPRGLSCACHWRTACPPPRRCPDRPVIVQTQPPVIVKPPAPRCPDRPVVIHPPAPTVVVQPIPVPVPGPRREGKPARPDKKEHSAGPKPKEAKEKEKENGHNDHKDRKDRGEEGKKEGKNRGKK